MNITIRTRQLSNGRKSIYLDYTHAGKRHAEFLKLYLEPGKDSKTRNMNKIAMDIAETVRNKRLLEMQHRSHGMLMRPAYGDDFLEFFEKQTEARLNSGRNYTTWKSALKHLRIHSKNYLTFTMLNEAWMITFKEYLENNLAPNSAVSYYNVVVHGIYDAIREEIIANSTALKVTPPKYEETHREFLKMAEIKILVKYPCEKPMIKRAFLFSCLTGLRFSDLQTLTWGQIHEDSGRHMIMFRQQKTKGLGYLPINDEAMDILGQRQDDNQRIFPGLKYTMTNNTILSKWVLMAGIRKHVTWHCGRHTNACLLLESGADIYVVSKLLGHKDVRTTQIYAKVVDESKQRAVDLLPSIGFFQ